MLPLRLKNGSVQLALLGCMVAACSGEQRTAWAHKGVVRFEGKGDPGAEQGRWSYWYENGQLREQGSYSDGKRIGVWRQWFQNGQRKEEGNRVWNPETGASERDGDWIFWHENGQLRSRGSYKAGKRQGSWEAWTDAGDVDPDESGLFEDDVKQP